MRPPLRAWRELFLLCREECTIELSRYAFEPEEVAGRVMGLVRVSRGTGAEPLSKLVPDEKRAALARMPRYERAIVEALIGSDAVYWPSEAIDGRLNALVSYPNGTVVLVIRPPGSGLELEIKRAGRCGRFPLGVVYHRSGSPVPRTHRLDGGSMTLSRRYEAASAALLSVAFRAIWRRPAPAPINLSTRFIDTVPVDGRAEHVLEYFSQQSVFGEQYAAMRSQMKDVVEAFEYEQSSGLPELEGERGLTVRFIHLTAPGQSVLAGTTLVSALALTRLLGDSGASAFFGDPRIIAAPLPGAERGAVRGTS